MKFFKFFCHARESIAAVELPLQRVEAETDAFSAWMFRSVFGERDYGRFYEVLYFVHRHDFYEGAEIVGGNRVISRR